jgi:PAS domain S-box-containing protein
MRHSKLPMNGTKDHQAPDDRFRLLVESAPMAIIMVDETGTILMANAEVLNTFGYEAQELVGKTVDLLVPDSVRPKHPGYIQSFFAKPERRAMGAGRDLAGRRKDGSELPIEIALSPIETPEGPRVLAFIADITERRKSEERFRMLVESAPTAIIMVDQTGTILLANPEVERTFGYNREELIRKPVDLLVPDSARNGHPGQLRAFFRKPERRSMGAGRDLTGRRKDGTEVPIEIALNPIQTSEGPCVLAFIADITERRTSERRRSAEAAVLALLNDRLSWKDSIPRILAAIGSSIGWSAAAYWQVQPSDASTRCEEFWSASPQSEELRHASLGSACGRGIDLPGKVWASREPEWITHLEGNTRFARTEAALKDGLHCGFAFPVALAGEIVGVIECFHTESEERDNSLIETMASIGLHLGQFLDRRRVDEELAAARDTALRAAQAKSEFLANMSHEIRTPMNAIIGMNDLLLSSELTARQRLEAETIGRSAESLLEIINGILDFSKIEAGKMVLLHVNFDLRETMDEVMSLLTHQAERKGLALALAFRPDVQRLVRGDPGRLRQILTNLVGNAIKFTQTGEIFVRAIRESQTDSELGVRFEVSDTGIGMSEDAQSRLFAPFYQADGSSTRRFGGTGLGLAISKQLAELMQGKIGVTSQPGRGSTFWFTAHFEHHRADLPMTAPTPTPSTSEAENGIPSPKATKILLVEDNLVNRMVALSQLQSLGYEADLATNGLEALEALERASYNIVLMDCQMPQLDGYEASREFRLRESRKPTGQAARARVHIIALTANAMEGDREKCIRAGMDDYLSKPYRLADLKSVLLRATSRLPATQTNCAPNQKTTDDQPSAAPAPEKQSARLDESPPVDLNRLNEISRNKPEMRLQILRAYFDQAEEFSWKLTSALSNHSAADVQKIAHKFKGSSATCGFNTVASLAASLETMGADNRLEHIAEYLKQCNQAVRRAKKHLETTLKLSI